MPADALALPERFPLRDGLILHPRNHTDAHVVLEDTENSKFFRIGKAESSFVERLLETGSASTAYQSCQQKHAEFSAVKAERFCKWLLQMGLVASNNGPKPAKSPFQNPLITFFFWKVPLCNPDQWLIGLNQRCGWLFGPLAMLISPMVLLVGIIATTGRWSEFLSGYENLQSSWRWIWIAFSWIVLKLLHEIAHGATCRRYGGEVKEAGMAMILLMPIAFVNVNSSWRFPSRWHRLHVTLAGVTIELLVAGVALLAWNQLQSMPLKQAAADVVLMASISSLLFNLNPLLKFDGYFALADLTGVDNLSNHGQLYARYFGGRYLLGLDMRPPQLPGKRPWWIKCYGCSAAVYRVFTVTGLLAAAAAIFHGAGLVIAAAGAVAFVLKPLMVLVRYLAGVWREGELSLIRLALRTSLLSLLLIGPLWLIPGSGSWTSPGIVQYSPPAVLRARSAGFVEQVHVVDGQFVSAGAAIVTLRNDELHLELLRQTKEIALVDQEILSAQWLGKSTELADAITRKNALQEQLEQLQDEVDHLTLRASVDGRVISRRLDLIRETYVDAGEELAVIGNEDSKRVKVSISQTEARDAEFWQGKPLRIIVNGHAALASRLTRLETRADTTPPDDSLLAIHGGSLASLLESEDRLVLCEPRVNGIIELTPAQSRQLRCGQRAFVHIESAKQSIGQKFFMQVMHRLFL
ncbi:MAG: biotin/lipoyl-binding protein [Planctomycetales bacterium]|nr:biotin/lipoyl-binding protein [Planctomycetales bacterium]